MKKMVFLFIAFFVALLSSAQTQCGSCNGYGKFRCNICGGNGVVYQQVYNPYVGMYQTVPCSCAGCGGYGVVICRTCGGYGYIRSTNPSFGSQTKWFVKTKKGCSICKSGNGCSGYWGIYHTNGTYEGPCQNTDGWGHSCGHSPEKHGLKSW